MKYLAIVMMFFAFSAHAEDENVLEQTISDLDKSLMFYGGGGLYKDSKVVATDNTFQLQSIVMADYLVTDDHERFAISKCNLIDDYTRNKVQRIFPAGYVEVRLFMPNGRLAYVYACDE